MNQSLPITFSDDQATAFDAVADLLRTTGVDLDNVLLSPPGSKGGGVIAVTGKAGSGKTLLLAKLYEALEDAGVDIVSGD